MGHNVVSAYASIQHHLKRTSLVARVAAILASGPGPVARASANVSTRSVRGLLPKIPCAMLKALPPAINQDHRRILCGQEILQALFCPDAIRELGYASQPPIINSDLDEGKMRLHSQSSNQRSMQPCLRTKICLRKSAGIQTFLSICYSTNATRKTAQASSQPRPGLFSSTGGQKTGMI